MTVSMSQLKNRIEELSDDVLRFEQELELLKQALIEIASQYEAEALRQLMARPKEVLIQH